MIISIDISILPLYIVEGFVEYLKSTGYIIDDRLGYSVYDTFIIVSTANRTYYSDSQIDMPADKFIDRNFESSSELIELIRES